MVRIMTNKCAEETYRRIRDGMKQTAEILIGFCEAKRAKNCG